MIEEVIKEAPEYFKDYIDLVKDKTLEEALEYTSGIERFIPPVILENLGDTTYAPGKWNVKELLQHIIDTERIFAFRALWFARGDETELPGFDQDDFVQQSSAEGRSVASLIEEFALVRKSNLALFHSFTNEMLMAKGVASQKEISVRALGYVMAGHLLHHGAVLKNKYIPLLRNTDTVAIADYKPEWNIYFAEFNKAWIERYFSLEPIDEFVLYHPEEAILKDGGKIYFAVFKDEVIGTVALKNEGDGIFELTKMAVDERFRGLGAGILLCKTAIEKARELKVQKLILFTQSELQAALNIYRRLGFKEVPMEKGLYGRANVKMEMDLSREGSGKR